MERRLSPEELQELIRQAGTDELRLVVIERAAPSLPPPDDELALTNAVEVTEQRLAAIFRGARADLAVLPARLQARWPQGWTGLAGAGLLAVLACTAAWLIELAIRSFARRRSRAEGEADDAGRYAALVRWVTGNLLAIGFQIVVAVVIFLALTERGAPERHVGYAVILVGCVCLRLGLSLVELFRRQAGTAAGITSGSALATVRRRGMLLAVALAILASVIIAIARLELGAGLLEAARLLLATAFVALLAAALWSGRRVISAALISDTDALAARLWPWLALAYLAGALALFVAKVLAGEPVNGLAILAPIYCGAIAAVAYALCMALLFRWWTARAAGPGSVDPASLAGTVPGDAAAAEVPTLTDRAAADAAATSGAVAAAVWAGGIALAWGIPLWSEERNEVHGFWAVLLILLIARIAWIAIRAFFDRRIAEEVVDTAPGESGDEGGGKGSRLGTVLPLFRSFLLITVGVIAAMIVLAQLGLDIGPMFAGAGLVGIAVGFGAQSLVRDIFSGLFFLVDDAFRVGEYIESGGLRGTVERISIRSMQLRHQNGPLHTIPFGEIAHLTNYSRDWVIMKLPIRVTFDTDPERVRKLIKKLGQELMADPLIGDKFVEPLKSQGVREIDESGQVIRVKFRTRPGEQFVLRKTVYARIREVFAREGIEFGAREVRVRVSPQDDAASESRNQAIGAAAAEGALGPQGST